MIGAFALVGLLASAWLFLRRSKSTPRTRLRVAASSLWMLDHFCVSLGGLLREWPELEEIRVALDALDILDEASIASLKGAIVVASKAQVRFRLDGYDVSMARRAMASGVTVEHLGVPRAAASYAKTSLH